MSFMSREAPCSAFFFIAYLLSREASYGLSVAYFSVRDLLPNPPVAKLVPFLNV